MTPSNSIFRIFARELTNDLRGSRVKCFFGLTSSPNCRFSSRVCEKESTENVNLGPLHGIRVLDLTRVLAGPYCTMILGDLGAEIIKVERPGQGDETRTWMPPVFKGHSCYFLAINRNKKSIALDLKKGSNILHDLAMKSDVIIENFLPGTMDKLGIGYEELSKGNPGLVYCSITGFGTSGPYKNRGGYDVIAASLGGLMHITGPPDGDPCKVGVAMTDLSTGLYAHGAIMAALFQRHSTKRGQRVDCNLLSTQLASLVNLASNYLNAGVDAKRWGTAHESLVPYETFKTKDEKWITLGAGNNELFFEICDALGLSEMKSDPKYATNPLRVANRTNLIGKMKKVMLSKTCEEWLQTFSSCKFPYGSVNDMKHAFSDPQAVHNKSTQSIGGVNVVSPAVSFVSGGNYPRRPPPQLGEHTEEVLRNILGLDDQTIKNLRSSNVIA